MMKNIPFFLPIAALFLISCSDSVKFTNSKPEPELDIEYMLYDQYIYASAHLSLEYYVCYWIIDGERFNYDDLYMERRVSYGEHFLEFVLRDRFGDTLSKSEVIRVNEPLKITLLSPVNEYKAAITDTIKFQYKISGVDTWEQEPKTMVYFSIDNEKWEPLKDDFLFPPFFWRIKADTVFSEIRSVWIKD